MGTGEKAFWRSIVISGGVGTGIYWGLELSPEEEILKAVGAPEGYIWITGALSTILLFATAWKATEHLRTFGLLAWCLGLLGGVCLGAGAARLGVLLVVIAGCVTSAGFIYHDGSASW